MGVTKVNVGSALKRAYFEAVPRRARDWRRVNPYEVVGSGMERDVLFAGGGRCRRWLRNGLCCWAVRAMDWRSVVRMCAGQDPQGLAMITSQKPCGSEGVARRSSVFERCEQVCYQFGMGEDTL